jgi:hypothetical protein
MRTGNKQRGSTITELALVLPFLVPLLLGSFTVGLGLTKSLQAQQVCRNAGILFLKYVDLSMPDNQDIVVRTAQGMGLTRTGGNGLVVLTQVMYVGDTECTTAGKEANSTSCPNWHQYVYLKRVYIGNQSLVNPQNGATLASSLGNPPTYILQPDGSVDSADYLSNPAARLGNFPMTLNGGEFAFVAETWFVMPELNFPGFMQGTANYCRYIS